MVIVAVFRPGDWDNYPVCPPCKRPSLRAGVLNRLVQPRQLLGNVNCTTPAEIQYPRTNPQLD